MRLTEVLLPQHIVAPLEARTYRGAVLELVQVLVRTGVLSGTENLERLTSEDRVRDVVHVGDRVLLPHLRTDAVRDLAVAIGVAPMPLQPAPGVPEGEEQVVVLVLAPPAAANRYLQVVAALARALRDEQVVAALTAARTPEQVLAIPAISELVVQPRLSVRDIMTQRVYRVFPDTPVGELLELMSRHDLKAVPVVGENREVLGVVTDRDLLRFLLPEIVKLGSGETAGGRAQARPMRDTPVREIMTRSVMCVSEDQGIAELVSVMVNKDVERLPVVGEGRLTGFLTRGDVLRKLFGK